MTVPVKVVLQRIDAHSLNSLPRNINHCELPAFKNRRLDAPRYQIKFSPFLFDYQEERFDVLPFIVFYNTA
jgi:hypothetical protein